jgi:hypothetical protein
MSGKAQKPQKSEALEISDEVVISAVLMDEFFGLEENLEPISIAQARRVANKILDALARRDRAAVLREIASELSIVLAGEAQFLKNLSGRTS